MAMNARCVRWADPLSRRRYASSPSPSAGSEGGATVASSTGGESSADEAVLVSGTGVDRPVLASSKCTCCLWRSSSAEDNLQGQHLLSRRFRCAATEAEYLEWHFSIWGRRTANFAVCVAVLVLVNLCVVLAGGSTRRRALDMDGSVYALGSLVAAPIAGAVFAGASVFLFSRTSFYSAAVHQLTTLVFLATAFTIDTVPRVLYAESDALEPPEGGLCNTTNMGLPEVASLAADDAASFAYAQCLILGAVAALAGLRPSGCTVVVAFQHGQSAPLGSAPARLLWLLRARLAALGGPALPE